MLFSTPLMVRADDEMPSELSPSELSPDATTYPETWPTEMPSMSPGQFTDRLQEVPSIQSPYHDPPIGFDPASGVDEWWFWPKPQWFGLRHSSTHGRHAGRGEPFVGTSWRNRPYYIGGQLGPMWFTQALDDDLSTDIDAFGGIFAGWDMDHYWGHELHFDWATPEFKNREFPDAKRPDSLFAWNYSLFYYPWGDSKFRPYWRAGIGNTHVSYPIAEDKLHDEWLWTFPLGVGMKYPVKRWLAARAELVDYIAVDDGHPTQHNVAVTFGLEWRFGAHPPSYWPWNPDRHIW